MVRATGAWSHAQAGRIAGDVRSPFREDAVVPVEVSPACAWDDQRARGLRIAAPPFASSEAEALVPPLATFAVRPGHKPGRSCANVPA